MQCIPRLFLSDIDTLNMVKMAKNPHCRDALHASPTPQKSNQFGSQSKNLSAIVRGFKASVTKQAREIHADFAWQSRYYEHIIRNQKSYDEITEYIKNNPLNWEKDSLYQSN